MSSSSIKKVLCAAEAGTTMRSGVRAEVAVDTGRKQLTDLLVRTAYFSVSCASELHV
jgi:hypothetical protein